MIKKIAFHPFLFGIFPVLSLFSHNMGELTIDQLTQPLLFSILVSLFMWMFINFIFQNRNASAVGASTAILFCFSYVHILSLLKIDVSNSNLLSLSVVAIALLAVRIPFLLSRKFKSNLDTSTLLLNVVSLSLIVTPSFAIIKNEVERAGQKVGSTKLSLQSEKDNAFHPDIYYIIVDRYASNQSLKEYFNFDNSGFTNFLKSKGFYVAEDGKSNYAFTTPSLASSLNMNYLDEILEVDKNSEDVQPLIQITEDNQVAAYLKSKGYKYLHFGPPDLPTEKNKNADFNYFYSENNLNISPFSKLFLEQTILVSFLESEECSTKSSFICIGSLSDRQAHYNWQVQEIKAVADTYLQESPKFVFYHTLLTHPPYVIDENGKYLPYAVEQTIDWRVNYVNQLKFTNTALRDLIETLLENSKTPPVIIIQADEGSFSRKLIEIATEINWKNISVDDFKEKFSILNAYYLPKVDPDILYPKISPVNSFRVVLNEYFDQELPLVDDRSYAQFKYRNPYDVFDVTNLLY